MSFGSTDTTENTTPAADPAATNTPAADQQPVVATIEYGGKQLTPEEVVKKLSHQDQFIETLKGEKDDVANNANQVLNKLEEMQTQLGTQSGLAQLLDQLKPAAPAPSEPATQQLPSTEELTETVRKQLRAEDFAAKQKSNMDSAMQAARAAYGEGFADKVLAMGAEAGYDVDGIDDLAQNHPKAFAKLFLPEDKPDVDTINQTVSTAGGGVGTPTKGDRADPTYKAWSDMNTKQKADSVAARMQAIESRNTQG